MADRRSINIALALFLASTAMPAFAQNVDDAAAGDDRFENNVIVVTAQKVEQDIQDVPISLSVIGGNNWRPGRSIVSNRSNTSHRALHLSPE